MRIRLTKRFRTVYVDQPLSEFRRHGAGISTSPVAEHIRAWEQIWKKSRCLLDDCEPAERAELDLQFAGLIVWKRVTECGSAPSEVPPAGTSQQRITPPGADLVKADPQALAVRLQWAEQRLREAEQQRSADGERIARAEEKIGQLSQVVAELRSSKTYRRVSWGFPRLRLYVDALESTLE